MDKRIVIATHGEFSKGIKTSLNMIFGDAVPVEYVTAYVDPSMDYSRSSRGSSLNTIMRTPSWSL